MARLIHRSDAPWGEPFEIPAAIPTMITPIEASYLRWLTASCWTGGHDVVEFGPWLGGSTWCLAAGMQANERRRPGTLLHAVDDFTWRTLFAPRAPQLDRPAGASFEDVFARNLEPFGFVRAWRRHLPDEAMRSTRFAAAERAQADVAVFSAEELPGRVGLVFVDAAKSWPGIVHLLREMVPRSVPGETLWTWQDFKLGGAYWVQLAVAAMLDRHPDALTLEHVVEFNSVTFRATERFGPHVLEAIPDDLGAWDAREATSLVRAAAALLEDAGDADGARLVELSAVGLLVDRGDLRAAAAEYRRLERAWPFRRPPGPLLRVRGALADAGGSPRSGPRGTALRIYHGPLRGLPGR